MRTQAIRAKTWRFRSLFSTWCLCVCIAAVNNLWFQTRENVIQKCMCLCLCQEAIQQITCHWNIILFVQYLSVHFYNASQVEPKAGVWLQFCWLAVQMHCSYGAHGFVGGQCIVPSLSRSRFRLDKLYAFICCSIFRFIFYDDKFPNYVSMCNYLPAFPVYSCLWKLHPWWQKSVCMRFGVKFGSFHMCEISSGFFFRNSNIMWHCCAKHTE